MTEPDKNIKDLNVLISEKEIQKKAKELALEIDSVFPENEIIYCICILKGSVMFFSELSKHLTHNIQMEFIRISSYGNEMKSTNKLQAVDLTLPNLEEIVPFIGLIKLIPKAELSLDISLDVDTYAPFDFATVVVFLITGASYNFATTVSASSNSCNPVSYISIKEI